MKLLRKIGVSLVYQEGIAGTRLFGEENREDIGGGQATPLCWPRALHQQSNPV